MFAKPERAVDRVFLHCSASDRPEHDNVETRRTWHLARGWSDVGYHYFNRKDGTVEDGRSVDLTPAVDDAPSRPTLWLGDRSGDVQILQQLLVEAGHDVIADGIFGQISGEAVRAFQAAHGLVADAIVGPATWKALQA
jgi:murein L,D-transpeptidase YcbB/YkuD